jgi:hypothetical protein
MPYPPLEAVPATFLRTATFKRGSQRGSMTSPRVEGRPRPQSQPGGNHGPPSLVLRGHEGMTELGNHRWKTGHARPWGPPRNGSVQQYLAPCLMRLTRRIRGDDWSFIAGFLNVPDDSITGLWRLQSDWPAAS